MGIGSYAFIPSETVIPLSSRFSDAHLIAAGQTRAPVIEDFEKTNAPIQSVILRPSINTMAVVDPKTPDAQPEELDMTTFFKGGGYYG